MSQKELLFRIFTLIPAIALCLTETSVEKIIISISIGILIWGINFLLEDVIKYIRPICVLLIMITSIYYPSSYFFLPSIYFNLNINKNTSILYIPLTLFYGLQIKHNLSFIFLNTSLGIMFAYLGNYIHSNASIISGLYNKVDFLESSNLKFKEQQKELIALEDSKIELNTQHEKQIIIAEIHDILGHKLSSSIIRLAALEYTVSGNDNKEAIKEVREQLNDAMNNVRTIIHAKRDASVDLENELLGLIRDNKSSAEINFTYQIKSEINQHTKHIIINIVREALSNIYKHSNASIVKISLSEINNSLNLLISDNGKIFNQNNSPGIGLINMEERVRSLGGTLHINSKNGFRIFINIPLDNNTIDKIHDKKL